MHLAASPCGTAIGVVRACSAYVSGMERGMRRAQGRPPLSMLHMTILFVQDRAVTCRLSASPFVCMHWTQ